VEICRELPIANTLKTAFLTLISLKHRSSDFKHSLIIFKLRAKQIAPFTNRTKSKKMDHTAHASLTNMHQQIAHTSSPSPFARKSNVDNVVLYFKQSAMDSAPDTPICKII
jgi:hypothetical protein